MFDQKEYDELNREKIKQRKKKYYIKNREYILQKTKQYNMGHKEERLQYIKKWQGTNYQKCLEYARKYQKTEKSLQYQKRYLENNRETMLEWGRKWRIDNPEKAKVIAIRHYNKRKRNLGFKPLNKPFDNSVAHHIDKIHIIYIPKEIHRSIRHCLKTDKNMGKINKLAISFL